MVELYKHEGMFKNKRELQTTGGIKMKFAGCSS